MKKTLVLLGSGELGKELVIALKRLGQRVIAVDKYADAPAMQVADAFEVIDMLNGDALDAVMEKHKPDLIVPEIEAIRTERLYDYEKQGITVVPSARAANFTMNRRAIRDLAAKDLGLKTAPYLYAATEQELEAAALELGFPCVVKPLMSSSGKGQSIVKTAADLPKAWAYSQTGRTGKSEVIVEGFIDFHTEITVLTVTQKNGETLFCPAIGHRQERGDYQESWQPCAIDNADFKEACQMAQKVTAALGGTGIWGVEFFLTENGVVFSELSPRPHDTGMVTMATQNLSEFDLHARAILGLPIAQIRLEHTGASAVILASGDKESSPDFEGVEDALQDASIDVRLFGKPSARLYRRMGVALCALPLGADASEARQKAMGAAGKIRVV